MTKGASEENFCQPADLHLPSLPPGGQKNNQERALATSCQWHKEEKTHPSPYPLPPLEGEG
jgi:hypothetical protein